MSIAPYDRETAPSTLELSDTIAGARPDGATTGGLSDALAVARPGDPAALALAQARIAGALFGGGASFGRFHVLERLGSGGMGAVYAAYDPELDRGVALKMVHVADRRDAALAEAKALARLSHPNVVPVFDVGIEGDEVYIVIELVRGETLRRWVPGRSPSEVLDVYRQAATALGAAHAAGLVHRDFKPDNAIVGHDGRVRVVDFGLACEASEQRTPAGTPGYMAPEQAAGGAVSPAADQYSFCVSLGEALDDARRAAGAAAGAGARPAWLAAILARGTASAPGDRFASMADLLRALGRDPARLRRRRIVAGAIAVATASAVAAAFFAGRASPAQATEPPPCEGGDAEIAAAWPPEARAAALDHIAGLGAYGSELAPRLRSQLDDYARRWASGRRDACLAHRRGLQSASLYDRRTLCLDRGRAAFAAVADAASRSEPALPGVAEAAASLPSLASCSDAELLQLDVAPPAERVASRVKPLQLDLAAIRIAIVSGRLAEVREWLDAIVEQARAIGYPPLVAEALLVSGQQQLAAEERDRALPELREASQVAFASGATALAVEAWSRWARASTTSARFAQPDGQIYFEALAALPGCAGFPRALLHATLGTIEFARGVREPARAGLVRGIRERARAEFERARDALLGVAGPGAVELAGIERGLAIAYDDPSQRDTAFAELEARLRSTLGADHPQTLITRYTRATSSVVALPAAATLLRDTCERYAAYDGLRKTSARCWGHLAELDRDLGDVAGSDAALAKALQLGAEANHFLPELVAYRSLWRGDPPAAIRQFTAAIAAKPATSDEPWFETYDRAVFTVGLAQASRAAGRPLDPARLRALVATLDAIVGDHPATMFERWLAHARAELAFAAQTPDAIAAGRAALAWWRGAGVASDDVTQLARRITAAPGSPR